MKWFTKFSLANALQVVAVFILFGYPGCSSNNESNKTADHTALIVNETVITNNSSHELKLTLNKLWAEHAAWTRNLILCIVDGLPGTDQAVNRLMQNQVDIGNAFKPYYGDEGGNKLTELLKMHIAISADVVKSANERNFVSLEKGNKKWHANADEISAFLSKTNYYWSTPEIKMMMHDYLKLTTDVAMHRIKKNYDADVATYDKLREETVKMSGLLADGIIEQFPEKFKPVDTRIVALK